jgi:hypothetical protein
VNRSVTISVFRLSRFHRALALVLCSAGLPVGSDSVTAQPTPPLAHASATRRTIPIRVVSHIDEFRELLAMTPEERARRLENKSPERKKGLLAKIKEYEEMSADEREVRLKITEVREYLDQFMKLSPIERLQPLSKLPAEDRELVERRLKIWDEIPPQLQKQFLKDNGLINYILQIEASTPEQRDMFLKQFSAEQRQKLESGLNEWQKLSAQDRDRLSRGFRQFFELNDKEKAKTLAVLSTAERVQMDKTLQSFDKLPEEQRRRCIGAFDRFASMKPEEREQFLKNAQQWEAMTPSQRQAWREIVRKTPSWRTTPPMPPGLVLTPPPLPVRFIAQTNVNR